jgi:hypothetical protein
MMRSLVMSLVPGIERMTGAGRVGIAQYDFEPAVDRRQHEARGNECP